MELKGNKEDAFKEKYFNLFGDIYKFMNKSYKLALTNEWEAIIKEVVAIDNKYKDNKFACDLIVAVMAELEKVSKIKENR